MDHRQYENWLLNDEHLNPEQDRELHIHLRSCPQCAALKRANLALRAAPVIGPAPGFKVRFQARLEAQRATQRKRSFFGIALLGLLGLGVLAYTLAPLMPATLPSFTQVFITWVSMLLYVISAAQAFGTIIAVFSKLALSIIPLSAWLLTLAMFSGLGTLWFVSSRRATRQRVYSAA